MIEEKNEFNGGYYKHELVKLRHDDKEDTDEECHSNEDKVIENRSFLAEVRHDKITRFNVVLSVCVAFAFSMSGWTRAQSGSAFLDILNVSGTDLEKGSTFMTSYYTGRVIGSILGGAIYSKVNRYLLLVVILSINNITLALIPWCAMFKLMITVHFIHGICNGIMGVVLTAVAFSIWGATTRGRVYINIFAATFAAMGLISPLVTSPFLLPTTMNVAMENSLLNASDYTTFETLETTFTVEGTMSSAKPTPHLNITDREKPASDVYVAYSISAGLSILSTIPFIVIYFKSPKPDARNSTDEESHFIGNLSLITKLLQLVNVGIFSAVFTSLDVTFTGYLAAFCVQHLGWTKTSGALLTSLFFLSSLFGRIFGVCFANFFMPLQLLMFSIIGYTVGLIGLSSSGFFLADAGIWISVSFLGAPVGTTWSSLLNWINELLVPVRGKTTSYLYIAAFCGALLSPLLFGYMMKNRSPIWFCYLSLSKASITVVNMVLMVVYTRYVHKSSSNRAIDT